MKGLWGGLLGALTLGASTAYYHTQLASQTGGEIVWAVVLLQAVPAGLLLGAATEWAMRVPVGGRRALCCFLGGLLGLVPPGIWGWLAVSGDPLHALPKLWETLVLCMPTLGVSGVLTLWGLTNLRPARFRKKDSDE